MVAGKLDPTVGQLYFYHIFQTLRNLQKGTTEMSSGVLKMVERSYGVAENGQKIKKLSVTHGGRRRRFVGPIPACPTAVGREILWPRSSSGGASPCPERVQ